MKINVDHYKMTIRTLEGIARSIVFLLIALFGFGDFVFLVIFFPDAFRHTYTILFAILFCLAGVSFAICLLCMQVHTYIIDERGVYWKGMFTEELLRWDEMKDYGKAYLLGCYFSERKLPEEDKLDYGIFTGWVILLKKARKIPYTKGWFRKTVRGILEGFWLPLYIQSLQDRRVTKSRFITIPWSPEIERHVKMLERVRNKDMMELIRKEMDEEWQ